MGWLARVCPVRLSSAVGFYSLPDGLAGVILLSFRSSLFLTPCICSFLLQAGRIGDEEKINEFEGMGEEEVEAIMQQREAHGRAQILEMVRKGRLD